LRSEEGGVHVDEGFLEVEEEEEQRFTVTLDIV
jgi:hypothetical protein